MRLLQTAILFLSVPLCLCGEGLAQDLTPRGKAQSKPVAIINATVHPVSEKTIQNGFVTFAEGKLNGVGTFGTSSEPRAWQKDGWRVIDAKGLHVYPGLIGARTQLGLTEIEAVRASNDLAEAGGITPEVKAATAVNPDSTLLPVTRSAGELIAAVFPGGGGPFPGRVGVIRLDGWTVADMTIREDAGLSINWPMTRVISAPWMNRTEDEQRKDIDKSRRTIEDMLAGARAHIAARAAGKRPAPDIRYDAMAGVFAEGGMGDKRLPVFVHAQDYDQIQQAIALCAKHALRCVIVGGRDAPMCADLLKRHGASVIVLGTYKFPKRDDSPYDDAFTLPARLEAAGVKWCFACGDDTAHERNLAPAAGMAVAYGLNHEAALRSITLGPAEMLGISDSYGSLEPGKSATLIVADGDILEVGTHVTHAFLDGAEVDLSDKQKKLDERYREKYGLPAVRPGT